MKKLRNLSRSFLHLPQKKVGKETKFKLNQVFIGLRAVITAERGEKRERQEHSK